MGQVIRANHDLPVWVSKSSAPVNMLWAWPSLLTSFNDSELSESEFIPPSGGDRALGFMPFRWYLETRIS